MAIIPKFLEGGAYGVLNDILSEYHDDDGYATPNRFEVIIHGPIKIGGGGLENAYSGGERAGGIQKLRKISLRCEAVNLPGRNVATMTDSNVYGPTREVVEGVTYAEDVTLTFQSSSGLDERKYFEQWQENMFNPDTWNLGYYNDYVGAVEIYLLDKQDKKRYGLKLWEAFPKTINATALNAASNNEIIKVDIGFSFRYWTALDTSQGQSPDLMEKITKTVVNTVERNISRNIPKILNRLL
jgi:hypothetical protein